jgi:hypothetical protein
MSRRTVERGSESNIPAKELVIFAAVFKKVKLLKFLRNKKDAGNVK